MKLYEQPFGKQDDAMMRGDCLLKFYENVDFFRIHSIDLKTEVDFTEFNFGIMPSVREIILYNSWSII